jgi:hypothetical protein
MAAFSTLLRFLKWKMDGKWKMENVFTDIPAVAHAVCIGQSAASE